VQATFQGGADVGSAPSRSPGGVGCSKCAGGGAEGGFGVGFGGGGGGGRPVGGGIGSGLGIGIGSGLGTRSGSGRDGPCFGEDPGSITGSGPDGQCFGAEPMIGIRRGTSKGTPGRPILAKLPKAQSSIGRPSLSTL
jgi:hypothetical protein